MRDMLTVVVTCTAIAASAGLVARPAFAAGNTSQPYRIAQNNSGGPNLFSLFQQIQQLQQQVRDLQGQVDTLQYKLKQSKQGQRELYQNLDKRLSALEHGGGTGGVAGNASASGTGNDDGTDTNVPADVQSAYMNGFNKLKSGKYDAAVSAFTQFVSQHPETALTDNAWYWLGEAYYVQQNMSAAKKAYSTVVNRFANSSKVPAALYELGLIDASQGRTADAKSSLQRVVNQYPNSSIAGQARQKLQSLGG